LDLKNKVRGGGENFLSEELHNLYYLPNIIGVIKLGRYRWTGYVDYVNQMRNAYRFWSQNVKERESLGNISIDERMVLKWILSK
jgi:hypothetical protein